MTRPVYPIPSHDPVVTGPPVSQVYAGLAEPAGTNAPAGLAAATGTANQPYIAAVGNAAATGTANQPEAEIGAAAGVASVVGDPTVGLEVAPGATATTPDHASFAVTDLDAEITLTTDWTPTVACVLLSQSAFIGAIGWSLELLTDGKLRLAWSTDGSLGTATNVSTTSATGLTDGTEHTIRVTLDVDNGAAGKTWTFYIDGVQFETASPAGTTSIFNSNQALTVGGPNTAGLYGSVRSAKLRASIGGSEVTNPDFGIQAPGTTSFADTAGRTWTVNAAALIHATESTVAVFAGVAAASGDAPQPSVQVTGGPTRQVTVVATDVALETAQVRYRRPLLSTIDLGAPLAQPETEAPAGGPTGTTSAPQPEAEIGAKPNTASAAGVANQAQVITGTLANAGVAAATGDALQATVVAVDGARPTQPVVAVDRAIQVATQVRRQQDTAQFVDSGAPVAIEEVVPHPTVVTDAASKAAQTLRRRPQAPTISRAPAPPAEATNAPAGLADAAGTAFQPEADIGTKPNTTSATGAADGQTVQTGAFTNAPAGLAAATGTANAATVTIRPNAGVGLAAGVANQPTAHIQPKAGVGLGAGTAPQAAVITGRLAPAGLASAAGTANTASVTLRVNAGVAAAGGEAGGVFALIGNPLGPPQGIGTQDSPGVTARDGVGLVAQDGDATLEVLR